MCICYNCSETAPHQRPVKSALRSLKKYNKLDFTHNCVQHEEFLEAVSVITEKCLQQLKQVLTEADTQRKGETMRKLWKHDVEEHIAFMMDQSNNGKN